MSQPDRQSRAITGSSYVKPLPFTARYKDWLYVIFTTVILVGMFLSFLEMFARSADVTEVKSNLTALQDKHYEDYAVIDKKLDRILYHLIGSSHDPVIRDTLGDAQ